ncbi:hypothetical protein CTI12_AA454130 [Artemisia annua]|uniref:RNI-like superfamily protein n=1 Tax=Artemisia annua TaxID=35608 RepID=A0A2U1LUA4_ARTAN|nr:hypothetical protein CTI12_AA454130 [Artemisia annua]
MPLHNRLNRRIIRLHNPYIHQNDRNSVSLVSRKLYELDSLTRKHVNLRNCYSIPSSRLVTCFPNLESLTLVGRPNKACVPVGWGGVVDDWVEVIVKSLKRLECVRFKRMIVFNEDLERLSGMCGERIKVLRIEGCAGFTTDGLLHIGKKCSGLRVLSFDKSSIVDKDGEWLRELAERSKRIETLSLFMTRLNDYCEILYLCPNLEVLYTKDTIEDSGLQFVGHICKKLRRITVEKSGQVGLVSDVGLLALAIGCLELESLHITIKDVRNVVLEFIGTSLKNLLDFGMVLHNKEEYVSDLPLDNGIRALLKGCTKLEKLSIHLRLGGLTDLGCGYIGKYGQNLRYMNLGFCPESDAGLVELSKGCPKLQKLEMRGCDFSQQALVTFVLNVTSLRYLWVEEYNAFQSGHDLFAMVRPFWNMELITYKPDVANAPEGPAQQKPPSLLAYYSLAEQRNDFPNSVIPLYPFVEFD